MKHALFTATVTLFSGVIFLPVVALSEAIPELEKGMTQQSVIQLWGAPTSKTERETKREELWSWNDRSVTFKSGTVEEWVIGDVSSKAAEKSMKLPGHGSDGDAPAQEGVEDILNDILEQGDVVP